jgi:outer membrane autotransporter protein
MAFNDGAEHIAETDMTYHHNTEMGFNDGGMTGMAAGPGTNGASMWLQGFGQAAKQDTRQGIKGYDADTYGTSIGVDKTLNNGLLGLSLNYGKTNANSKNADTTGTDIDSYGLNLYGSHDFAQMFMNVQAGYNYNKIKTFRHNVGGPGLTANGDYHSDQYSAKVGFGRDYLANHGLVVTPSMSAAYTDLKTAGYSETGTGPLLSVDSQTFNSLKLGIGATAAWHLKNSDGSRLTPSISAGYAYDAIGDTIDTTAQFIAGGPAFQTMGAKPARSEVNGGLGLTYTTTANWDLSANYDYTHKENYDAHTGVLRMTSHF